MRVSCGARRLSSPPAPGSSTCEALDARRRSPSRPAEEFYARQLADQTGLTRATVRYELARLERLEFVLARRQGQEKLYRANGRHPLLPVLKQMVYKTAGLGDALREALVAVPGVQAAFIFGSVAEGTERATSDIDLFILGELDGDVLAKALHDGEGRLGREINVEIPDLLT